MPRDHHFAAANVNSFSVTVKEKWQQSWHLTGMHQKLVTMPWETHWVMALLEK